MEPFNIDLLTLDTFYGLLKWVYVFAFFLYSLFAVVVLSQIKQMTQTLKGELNLPLKTLGFIHLGLAIAALLIAIVIL